MITADTLAKRLDTLLDCKAGWQTIAEAVLQIIGLDDDQLIVLPIAPMRADVEADLWPDLQDHHTIARIVPAGGCSPAFLADPHSHDYIRNRFRGHP